MSEQQGWIKLYRKFVDWEWYTDANVVRVFLHLILTANYSPKKWRGMTINTGELITSISSLSLALNLSEQQIRTALKKLKKTGEIEKTSTNKNTLIKVLNYEVYQGLEIEEQQSNNNQITNKKQSNNNQITTNKNNKNKKNKKNDKNIIKDEKNAEKIPCYEIVAYLNEKAEKNYRVVDSVKELIAKRFSEGFNFEDFKTVIDVKCSKWKNDEKMNLYLRPETLFGQKFQNYLNEKPITTKSSYDINKAIKRAEEGSLVYMKNAERRRKNESEEKNSSGKSS